MKRRRGITEARMGLYAAGLDVGTTNIELLLVDLASCRVAARFSAPVRRLASDNPYAFEQDAAGVAVSVRELFGRLTQPVASVGITGQVHGILYTDDALRPLSPLYNWLDRRGVEPWNGGTPQSALEERTGIRLASGAGLLTHYANRLFGRVPSGARRAMGIAEFVAGNLIGTPLYGTDDSMLAALGMREPTGVPRTALLEEVLSSDCPAFPEAAPPFSLAGHLVDGVCPVRTGGATPVACPVGDNQAGFFGALPRPEGSCLVSIGTSGQISFFSRDAACPAGMELRPYLGKGYLQVGATLAAGKSYEALASFVAEIVRASGSAIEDEAAFTLMNEAARAAGGTSLVFETSLGGTRQHAAKRGTITGIGLDNFRLGELALAAIEGIVRELAEFTEQEGCPLEGLRRIAVTGSAPGKNPLFLEAVRRRFKDRICEPALGGAALGAAVIGALAAGLVGDGDTAGLIEGFNDYSAGFSR
jgi:sedoheptulokinase